MTFTVIEGDSRTVLGTLPAASVQCCVTSPPYYGLRDYGHAGQIGLEATPAAYVAEMVALFREVRRVLKDDGTLFLNLGDSYAATTKGSSGVGKNATNKGTLLADRSWSIPEGLKQKDIIGIPWRVAFALQADGWYLRSDIIWHKPNQLPESVTDRPTKAHEYVFLLTKAARYYYDAAAIAEPALYGYSARKSDAKSSAQSAAFHGLVRLLGRCGTSETGMRNARSVWSITTQPFKGAHFATMPPALVERCIKAGSRAGDMVLDPFGGAGTTGLVADRLGRDATLIELNPTYAQMARDRMTDDAPLFGDAA